MSKAALDDLEAAIRYEQPGNPVLAQDHTNRGVLLYRDGQPAAALDECSAALAIVPSYPDAHHLRLQVLTKLKKYDDVIRSCDVVLAGGKPEVWVFELRGLAQAGLGNTPGAIEDYSHALELKPGDTRLLSLRGWSYLVSDAPRLAEVDFAPRWGVTARLPRPSPAGAPPASFSARRGRAGRREDALRLGARIPASCTSRPDWCPGSHRGGGRPDRGPVRPARRPVRGDRRRARLRGDPSRPRPPCAAFWRDTIQADPALHRSVTVSGTEAGRRPGEARSLKRRRSRGRETPR